MGADVLDVESAADHRFQRVIGGFAFRGVELGVAQVSDARCEAEAQQVHQGKDVIGEARRVRVMFLDAQVGLVVQQAVKHVGGIAHADIRLDMQVKVDNYRLDFVANRTFIIEIDGAAWHSSPEAVERDRVRDAAMVAKGYKVLRIPAKVVLNTPKEAVRRVDVYLGRIQPEPAVSNIRKSLNELLKHQQALSTDPVMNPAAKNVLFVEKDGAKLDAEVDARTMPHGCMESKFHT